MHSRSRSADKDLTEGIRSQGSETHYFDERGRLWAPLDQPIPAEIPYHLATGASPH